MSYSISTEYSPCNLQGQQEPSYNRPSLCNMSARIHKQRDSVVKNSGKLFGVNIDNQRGNRVLEVTSEDDSFYEKSTNLEMTPPADQDPFHTNDNRPVLDKLKDFLGEKRNFAQGTTNIPTYFRYPSKRFFEQKAKTKQNTEELSESLSNSKSNSQIPVYTSALDPSTQTRSSSFSEGPECFSMSFSRNNLPATRTSSSTSTLEKIPDLISDETLYKETEIFPRPTYASCRRLGFFLIS